MRATFVTLAAYDFRLLPASIASYHEAADEILVGLDADRVSWSGQPFECDRAELDAVLAPFPKARVLEGNFHSSAVAMENDSQERAFLASLARNEWVVEVDADESVDGAAVVAALADCPEGKQLYGFWSNVYKVIDDTALVVEPAIHTCPLATKSRSRKVARITGEPTYLSRTVKVLHFTTCRSEPALVQKLTNWSHSGDVRPGFLDQWRGITLENYQDARNLHPFIPSRWPALRAVPVASLGGAACLGGRS